MGSLRFQRALLVNPPTGLYRRDDRCQCRVEEQTVQIIFPPMDLASLGAVLRRVGVEPTIRDYPAAGAAWEDYVSDLRRFRPDMVLVNVTTATVEKDFQALAVAKQTLGERAVATLARGEYMDALGERALGERPEVDYGFHGEIEQVLERLATGAPLEDLAGLVWRRPGGGNGGVPEVVRNSGTPVVEDLDALPMPARDLLDNDLYRSPETGRRLTVVHGNRGCPSRCIFCPAGAMSGYRLRFRSPAKLMEEIEQCVRRFGIREFLFHGDTFTINKRWLLRLCEEIEASGLSIRWGCNSRVDTIDEERAAALRRAGCWVVAFGIESGSQELLDRMKKGQTLGQAERAVAICKRHGLRTHAFYVIGMPWETEQTLAQTLRFARRLDTDFFDFNIAYPLPGTELFEIVEREGLFESGSEAGGYGRAAVRTYALTSEQLTRWRRQALLSLYLRPDYIGRMLWRAGSPRVAWNYARAGARRLRQLALK